MNKDNVLAVADAIERRSVPGMGFNMRYWSEEARNWVRDVEGHQCGTVACIGGWTEAIFKQEARKALDLGYREEGDLFYPLNYLDATPPQAVAVLRHLAETGEVNWSVADTVTP